MNWRVGPLFWVVLLLALFCPAQTAPDKPPPPLPYIDPDAYDVYSAIVPTLPIYQSAGTVVVQRETAPNNDLGTPRQCLHGDKQFQDDYAEVFDDYEQENRSAKLLEPNFDFDKPFDFISIDDFVRPAATRGRTRNAWGAFFHRFPDSGGYVVVSAVGFNSEKTAAVLYVGRKCGPIVVAAAITSWRTAMANGRNCHSSSQVVRRITAGELHSSHINADEGRSETANHRGHEDAQDRRADTRG